MARRATVAKQEKAKGSNVLLLDAGDTLFGAGILQKADSATLLGTMNLMGYNAMTIGDVDLSQGTTALQDLTRDAKFPLLAANLQPAKGVTPFWKPYTILQIGGQKVAVLGLVSDKLINQTGLGGASGAEVTVVDPIESARGWVSQLQKETKVIVVLSHLGLDGDRRLAQEVTGISAIVGGHSQVLTDPPEVVGPQGTVIAQAGFNGEYLGILRLKLDEKGHVLESSDQIVALTPEVADDPEVKAFLQSRLPKP